MTFHMQTTGITVLNMFFDVCVSSRTLSYQLEFMSTVYTANLDLHIFCLHTYIMYFPFQHSRSKEHK